MDGTPEVVSTFTYDGSGRAVHLDMSGGQVIVDTYESDPSAPFEHRWTRLERDVGVDGSIERITDWTWDGATGLRTADTQDQGYGGYSACRTVEQWNGLRGPTRVPANPVADRAWRAMDAIRDR